MRTRSVPWLMLALSIALPACESAAPLDDGGATPGDDAAVAACTRDDDCDDTRFCNGEERCAPGDPAADAGGCVRGPSPCDRCSEALDRCIEDCAESTDADGDGRDAIACGGDDCDDGDPLRAPGTLEICDPDDRDEDCDPTTFGVRDADGDGSPDGACCNVDDEGVRACGDDCDDARPGVHPRLPEVCDGLDSDCDGAIDEDVLRTFATDGDGDGFGSADPAAPTATGCFPGPGFADDASDCDDANRGANPAAPEVCDLSDNDCDLAIDEGVQFAFWPDDDRDGFGDATATDADVARACSAPDGFAANRLDCDDAEGADNPAAREVCDGDDDDCDTRTDEGALRPFYPDADGDRFGSSTGAAIFACDPPAGYVADALDCDDTTGSVRPGLADVCDGLDNDCRGGADTEPEATMLCGTAPFGTVTCDAAMDACRITSCTAPQADCDLGYRNGCETNTSIDADHCGVCGRDCGLGGVCTASACDGISQVSLGGSHSLLRRAGGAAISWGAGGDGQLGTGVLANAYRPEIISALPQLSGVGAGASFSCGWRSYVFGSIDVTDLWCWGRNARGQLGDGSTIDSALPRRVSTGHVFLNGMRVVGGSEHTCAYSRSGSIIVNHFLDCWGRNDSGQVGVAAGADRLTPQAVTAPAGSWTSELGLGLAHTCAVLSDARVACWGGNASGQLGFAGAATSTPTIVPGLTSVTRIAVGGRHTCALRTDGTVTCWGRNLRGQTGRPSSASELPAVVAGLSGVAAIAAGEEHTCAMLTSGGVRCWGDDFYGTLGDGGASAPSSTPVAVSGITDARLLASGGYHVCAVHATGRVSCWGNNISGELADGTPTQRTTPTQVTDL